MATIAENLRIRAATDADAPSIWSLLEPVFRGGESYCVPRGIDRAQALAYWSGGNHQVFVAQDQGTLLGSYFLCPNQQGGGAHVANAGFVTARAAQGRGVARAMLDHALHTARAQGYLAMQFNFVVASNTRAIALWERAGFDTVGRIPDAFEHPELGLVDALIMYREL